MAGQRKIRRLLEASERFNSFHRLVDMITVLLFLGVSAAVANKLLPGKFITSEYLQWSWQMIAGATGLFLFLFVGQTVYERQGRILSEVQKEAALKAARKNNYRNPYR